MTLQFKSNEVEKAYLDQFRQLDINNFQIICLIGLSIYILYSIKDYFWVYQNTVMIRIFVGIPLFIFSLLAVRSRLARESDLALSGLQYLLVFGVVTLGCVYGYLNPTSYTQISHNFPAIMYGSFLFVGFQYRQLISFIAPIVFALPLISIWMVYNYTPSQKVDVTSILLIHFIIGLILKRTVENYRRKSFKQQKQLEAQAAELEDSHKILEVLNQQKDKLFSIVSHDLRGPFGQVQSLIKLLEQTDCNSSHYFMLFNHLKSAASQARDLLENLLNWSRSQIGGINVNKEYFHLKEIVDEMIELFRTTCDSKSITIKGFKEDIALVYSDKEMVKTVMRNIIANCIKFSNTGSQVEISSSPCEGKYIEIVVKDYGVGMSAEKLSGLFTSEVGKSSKGTMNEPGTGLGLTICKEFIELNNGELKITSAVGVGSEFIIRLPNCS